MSTHEKWSTQESALKEEQAQLETITRIWNQLDYHERTALIEFAAQMANLKTLGRLLIKLQDEMANLKNE